MHQKPTDEQLANRFLHHPPVGDQAERYAAIRARCLELAKFIRDNTPCCAEQTRSINAVDEAMMLANAAIARNELTSEMLKKGTDPTVVSQSQRGA